jgi:hypothetical protein
MVVMKKQIEPLLIYWLLIAISIFLLNIVSCSKVNAEQTWQYIQTKVRKTVVGRLDRSKTVHLRTTNRDVLYILVRHSKSKKWFPVCNAGIEYPDRIDPYCIIYWGKIDTGIKFYNLRVGDYYQISVLR